MLENDQIQVFLSPSHLTVTAALSERTKIKGFSIIKSGYATVSGTSPAAIFVGLGGTISIFFFSSRTIIMI